MFKTTDADFASSTSCTFQASYCSMTTSYMCMPPLSTDTMGYVTYLTMRDADGVVVDVPCTLVAAELIRLYEPGTLLTLYISPRVLNDEDTGFDCLIPLCIGAVRAL